MIDSLEQSPSFESKSYKSQVASSLMGGLITPSVSYAKIGTGITKANFPSSVKNAVSQIRTPLPED